MHFVGWISKITLKKFIRNKKKKKVVHEDTCWNVQRDEISSRNENLGEKLTFLVKDGGWDLTPEEESKYDNGRGKLAAFLCLR